MRELGLEPADMRLRKPVLTNTQNVLDRGGYEQTSTIRELVATLPDSPSALDFARAMGIELENTVGGGTFMVAELTVPGTDWAIPLEVDLSALGMVL